MPWIKSLERLGISAKIRLVDISQYVNRMRKHDYDVFVQSYDFVIPPTLEARSNFHSSALMGEGSRNYTGVNSPVIDFLIETAEAADTLEPGQLVCPARRDISDELPVTGAGSRQARTA